MIRSRMGQGRASDGGSVFSQLGAGAAYEASDSESSVGNNMIDAFSDASDFDVGSVKS